MWRLAACFAVISFMVLILSMTTGCKKDEAYIGDGEARVLKAGFFNPDGYLISLPPVRVEDGNRSVFTIKKLPRRGTYILYFTIDNESIGFLNFTITILKDGRQYERIRRDSHDIWKETGTQFSAYYFSSRDSNSAGTIEVDSLDHVWEIEIKFERGGETQ